ncbi:hypothetical protein BFAG_03968 [Bacteroides fragilis 3_1_12]|uniref:Transposase n=1 Tax=Bacteroides fragilis 3_1_12 TaxID=457424 RepID=A0ABN0BR34_BACFG|nr:hypothetical protein BFAG_03968 [Bacteroides fragilis 3_1_12]
MPIGTRLSFRTITTVYKYLFLNCGKDKSPMRTFQDIIWERLHNNIYNDIKATQITKQIISLISKIIFY